MSIKQDATTARNAIQQGIYAVINPFVRLLVKMGVTPNMEIGRASCRERV